MVKKRLEDLIRSAVHKALSEFTHHLSTEQYLSSGAVARYLGKISAKTLTNWHSLGRGLRVTRIGDRRVRYRRSDLDAFLTSNKGGTEAQ